MRKKYFTIILISICLSLYSQNPIQTTLWDYQPEGFEGATFPPTDWQVVHFAPGTTDWEHSTSVGGFQNSASSAFFNNIDAIGNVYVMRTPSFDLSTAINPTLTFDLAYASDYSTGNNSDRFRLYRTFNTNGTSGWQTVPNSTFQNETLVTAPNQSTYFTPDEASDWSTFTIDLTAYAGQSYVRFAFESNPGVSNNVIYIDNVDFYDASPLAISKVEVVTFDIFPNPTTDKVTLNTDINLTAKNVQIHNTLGQEFNSFIITKNNTNSYELDLESFSKGAYYISIKTESNITTKMIVVK